MQELSDFDFPKILMPFAASDPDRTIPQAGDGFLAKQATPVYNGGTQITRHDLNGLGYLATIGSFLERVGYPNADIGRQAGYSYPKGAIITEVEGDTVCEWVSLHDNNNQQPYGTSIGDVDAYTETGSWAPVHKVKNYNFFPDYSNPKTLLSTKILQGTTLSVTSDTSGWVLVKRTINNWDELTPTEIFSNVCTVDIAGNNPYRVGSIDELGIQSYEGKVASRLFPLQKNLELRCVFVNEIYKSITVEVLLYPFEETVE